MQRRRMLNKLCTGVVSTALLVLTQIPVMAVAEPVRFELTLAPAKFVLPQFTGPYTDREASIAPEEYERAERLRTMLDAGQRQDVIKELEAFYDIELSPAMLALKGQIYASLEIYDKAEATYLAVLRRQPQLIRVHSDLAQLYLVQEKFKEARQHFSKAVALGSSDALVHGQLAYLNLTQYGPFSAITGYQTAMAIEPENQHWQRGLLAALTQANMIESAEALLKELLAKHPDDAQLWLNRAALALHQENINEALVGVEMAIILGDDDPQNLKTAAQLHLQQGHYDRALVLLRQGIQKRAFAFDVIEQAADWLIQTRALTEARELLNLAEPGIDRLSGTERSRYYLQRARLARSGNAADTEALFSRSLEANPANGRTLVAYAEYLAENKKPVNAELMYIRAEAIPAVEKDAMLGRAQLYIDQRDYSAALKLLAEVLKRNPSMRELVDNIETLENVIRTTESTNDPAA